MEQLIDGLRSAAARLRLIGHIEMAEDASMGAYVIEKLSKALDTIATETWENSPEETAREALAHNPPKGDK